MQGNTQNQTFAILRLQQFLGWGKTVATGARPERVSGADLAGEPRRVIELDEVTYGYGNAAILGEVTLTLEPGSFLFLTGPSGAGKTTLMRLCYGALIARQGRVTLFGEDVRTMSRDALAMARRRIGVVHQDQLFLDHLTVSENVALPLTVAGRPVDAEEVDDLLAWVGLAAQKDSHPPELSGGERQRAALARAIIMSPEVILADEPTGNVDWEMSVRLLQLMIELNRMGKTVMIATHDLNLIRTAKAQVQARVLRIAQNRVQLAGASL